DLVNIRDNPNTEANILGSVVKGLTLELLGQNEAGDWTHVCCIHGQSGWVYSELVQHKAQVESEATAQAVKIKLDAPLIVGWQTFESPELGFTVVLPGMPNKQISALHTDAGALTYSVFSTGFEGAVYTVGFADLPNSAFEPSLILDSARNDLLASLQGTLIDEHVLDDQGFSGREFNLAPPNTHNHVLVRLYLSNARLYVLTVTTTKELAHSDNVLHFLNSFQLLAE
ncbi:MAG: SH3 domain-containing protein, partial [Chloroflexi bacterium]|nr:SH3 domain-containing protein [Chloroflexota bacterium]